MSSHPSTPHEGPHDMDEGDMKDYWDAYWDAHDRSQHVASSTSKEGEARRRSEPEDGSERTERG